MSTRTENAAKKLARLAAVQALYQIELTGRPLKEILKNYKDNPGELIQEIGLDPATAQQPPDFALLGQIVTGVMGDLPTVDGMINGAVDARHSADRIEILLRSILRCGTYELYNHTEIAQGIVVNDYVDVAHAYFNANEPGLVNAVLDKLSKNLRS